MIHNYFPFRIREIIKKSLESCDSIEEIRVRCGQNIVFCNRRGKWFLNSYGRLTKSKNEGIKLYKEDLREMIKYFTHNSVYAMQQDIVNGFITLVDGTRVGLCGRCIVKNGEIENINNISSFNIRLSRQVLGWGQELFEEIKVCSKNVLIIAPPGLGKTTLLRNMIKFASDNEKNLSVIDERCEISPIAEGERIYDLGLNTDVLSDVPKRTGMNIMLRTMNPEIVATDELLTKEDFEVIQNASVSGVKIFATFHGLDEVDYISKLKNFGFEELIFDCFILISENEKNERVISYKLQEEL